MATPSAATCVAAQVDEGSTCGNAGLSISNYCTNSTFVVIPRLARQPGGACLVATGFNTPFLISPGQHQTLQVPTLVGGSSTVPPNTGGKVDPFYPYNASGRVAFVDVTYVLVTSAGVTSSELAQQEDAMWTYLQGKVDMNTLSTAQFVINTCSSSGEEYHISNDYGKTVMIESGISVVTHSAPHPNRTSPNMLSVGFHDMLETGTDEPDEPPYLTPAQRDKVLAGWPVFGYTLVCIAVFLMVGWGLREMHHWTKRPVSAAERFSMNMNRNFSRIDDILKGNLPNPTYNNFMGGSAGVGNPLSTPLPPVPNFSPQPSAPPRPLARQFGTRNLVK